jgi:murein DD-endopeptidase MepM/ murein hydrolase activator NlpD
VIARGPSYRHLSHNRSTVGLISAALVMLPICARPVGATESATIPPPVSATCISSGFGPRFLALHPAAGHFHDGIDLPAGLGAPVRAVAPGTIIRVQRKGLGGLEMLVQHDGFIGVYSHLGLIAPPILEGRRTLIAGEQLGTVGRSGMTSGPHMFFGMIVNGKPVDPTPYLRLPPCGHAAPQTPTG